jgi:hypothetical protein
MSYGLVEGHIKVRCFNAFVQGVVHDSTHTEDFNFSALITNPSTPTIPYM